MIYTVNAAQRQLTEFIEEESLYSCSVHYMCSLGSCQIEDAMLHASLSLTPRVVFSV